MPQPHAKIDGTFLPPAWEGLSRDGSFPMFVIELQYCPQLIITQGYSTGYSLFSFTLQRHGEVLLCSSFPSLDERERQR